MYMKVLILLVSFLCCCNCATTDYSTTYEYGYVLVGNYILIGDVAVMDSICDYVENDIDSLRSEYRFYVLSTEQSSFCSVETEQNILELINIYNHKHWFWSANNIENEWKYGDYYKFVYLLLSKGYRVYNDCETGGLIIKDNDGNTIY